jgi:tetratricopeptide (TPR) repeat protein
MLVLSPNSHQGLYYKAVALDKQDGQLERVKDLLKKSIHLDPGFVDARVALGDVLLRERQVAAGIDELKSALRLKPDHVRAQYRLAMAYRDLGQEESAREAFQKFQQLKAQQPSGWVSLFQLESGADGK